MFSWFTRWRQSRYAARPLPEDWYTYLEEHVPFYTTLPNELKEPFLEKLKAFVWDKYFIGAGGMEITDEIKVVISAVAVRLVLHLDLSYYDKLTEIIVYPGHYKHPEQKDGFVLGEAHQWGTMVLSWKAVLHGLKNTEDGQDTATHEFAHVLDIGGGQFNGTPHLRSSEDYQNWASIMSSHYLKLKDYGPAQRKVLDMYGAINEAEFFAVATESFFEKAEKMKRILPELYEELKQFYGWDPAQKTARQRGIEPETKFKQKGKRSRISDSNHKAIHPASWKTNTRTQPSNPTRHKAKHSPWKIDKSGRCKS